MASLQVPVVTVWVDGSFVTQKEFPNDLDILYFIQSSHLNRNYQLLDQVRSRYSLLHVLFAEHHVVDTQNAQAINRIEKFKWFSLFGSKNQQPKGFLELQAGP